MSTRLLALAERLRGANCGSMDLNADIYLAFGYEVIRMPRHVRGIAWRFRGYGGLSGIYHRHWEVQQDFTRSLDAAKRLWWRLPVPDLIPSDPLRAAAAAIADRASVGARQ